MFLYRANSIQVSNQMLTILTERTTRLCLRPLLQINKNMFRPWDLNVNHQRRSRTCIPLRYKYRFRTGLIKTVILNQRYIPAVQ